MAGTHEVFVKLSRMYPEAQISHSSGLSIEQSRQLATEQFTHIPFCFI